MAQSLLDLAPAAETALETYCYQPQYAWPSYDTADRTVTALSLCDVTIAELIQAQIPAPAILNMFQATDGPALLLREKIDAILADPAMATENFHEVPFEHLGGDATPGSWGKVREAFRLALEVHGLGSVGVSKILHRLRPDFVPVQDRRLREFYGVPNTAQRSNRFYEALHIDLHRTGVIELLDEWRSPYPGMTRLRAADIVIWMHS